MISLDQVAARRSPLALANVSLAWGPGIHAVVGGSADGGRLLLALIAGAARPRAGHVYVLDGAPTDAALRPQVAFIPLQPALPEAMRVGDALALAAAVRGEPTRDAAERLSALGVDALLSRRVETLSREETRAVAIAEATTSARVRVLLIEEPLVSLDPRAATHLPEVLRARSREGCAVVVATASVRDAGELADDYVFLRDGAVVGEASSLDALVRLSLQGVRLRILTSDARALLMALAREEEVEAIARRDDGTPGARTGDVPSAPAATGSKAGGASAAPAAAWSKSGAVVARGRDAIQLARAAGRAIVASGVDVTEMRVEPASLDEVRAAVAEMAAASAEAAFIRTPKSSADSPRPPPGPGQGPPAPSGDGGP